MLQIKNVRKQYVTGDLTQDALNDVSFNLRNSEFVAVLGQSGSGKTTLLNIIGGLDRYDSGDIIINNVSTKKYTDRDWDSYRNHTIGFVFQSYNLIPHQSILSNVELALTISGVSNSERKKRAKKALEEVGLGEQLHKKPTQMSGGQMQRVAIARALVNDPDILLADEPTGALDSETSVQVMNLLREVAKDRLVVMVTHNAELADEYANRIIKLHDGKILNDSNPYEVDVTKLETPKHKNLGKASMSFITALSLSFNNLRTKKARTILTAFAGSIGIIGIALILSLSNGVNDYIVNIQKETMVSYPISIEAQSFDLSSILASAPDPTASSEIEHERDGIYSNSSGLELAKSATSSIKENNLTEFKKYLDNSGSEIHQYIGTNGIIYSYGVKFNAYVYDPDGTLVNTDGSDFTTSSSFSMSSDMPMSDMSSMSSMSSMMGGMPMSDFMLSSNFEELLPGADGTLVSTAVTENYDVLYGNWPQSYDEVVLVLDKNNEISTSVLYELGLLPSGEYKEILQKLNDGEDIDITSHKWSYEDICNQTFYMIPACDTYALNKDGLFEYIADDEETLKKILENSVKLNIVGVARPTEDASYTSVSGSVGYTKALSDYIIEYTDNSAAVKAQEKTPDTNIISGMTFKPMDDNAKIADTIEYLEGLNISDKAALVTKMMGSMSSYNSTDMEMMPEINEEMMAGMSEEELAAYASNPESAGMLSEMSETELAAMLDEYLKNPEDEVLLMIYEAYISAGSYDDNMSMFGVVSLDAPASINIYADSFENKDAISDCIENYNKTVSNENQITYTDMVALLMSSITTIINVITYVLVAFVAVSLVVSSIMIGIITFISVLERTKEIGILRAMGASKGNVSQIFNAETFIIGLISGLLGVGITYLCIIPINAIIKVLLGTAAVSASLPVAYAAILVALSMGLSIIAGLIPSRKAAKKDPVIALRTE